MHPPQGCWRNLRLGHQHVPMRPRPRIPLAALALSALTAVAPELTPAQPTPEETAQRFFDGLSRLRWTQVSAQMHTEALADFHLISRQLVESLRGDSILIQLYDTSREE